MLLFYCNSALTKSLELSHLGIMFMVISTIAQKINRNAMIETMILEVNTADDMVALGKRIGGLLRGGEMIELVGDVGAGKTTFTKGLAQGLSIDEDVQSPSFTISRVYDGRDGIRLAHYDFYRLHDPGIMGDELREALSDAASVVIVEWADIAAGVLPDDRLTIHITPRTETSRSVEIIAGGDRSGRLEEAIAK